MDMLKLDTARCRVDCEALRAQQILALRSFQLLPSLHDQRLQGEVDELICPKVLDFSTTLKGLPYLAERSFQPTIQTLELQLEKL